MPEEEPRRKFIENPDGTFSIVEEPSGSQGPGSAVPNVGGWQRSRDPVTGEDVIFNPTTREIERRPGTPPPQRGGLERLPTGQYLAGGRLLTQGPDRPGPGTEVYDPTTGETGGRYYEPGKFAFEPTAPTGGDWRVQGGYLVNQRTGQIMDVSRPSARPAGRTVTPGEEEQNLAAAANQRAQAAYNQARADGYQEEQARQIANDEWQRTYQQGQLEIQRGQLGLQTRLGEQRLGLDERQLAAQIANQQGRLGLDERQLDNASRDALARQAIERGQLDLARQIQGGQLDVQRNRLGLEERLGTERLGLDRSTLENARNQAEAERNLRARTALGDIGGQQTLEAELGRRAAGLGESRLGLDTRRFGFEQEMGRGTLANQTAGLYGFGPQGRTLESQRLAGELTGGTPTLERTFGYSDRLGTLDGQTTLAGRQANLAEDTAAFQRLSTPSAVGNLAALERRGLVPASALQTGQVGGLAQRTGRFGGVGSMGGGVTAPPTSGRMFAGGSPDFNERTGQYNQPSPTFGAAASGGQAPLQYSLQSLKGLSPRDTQTLAGYTGAMGRDFGDIQNQAVNEMADLGEGLQRRRGYRLGG